MYYWDLFDIIEENCKDEFKSTSELIKIYILKFNTKASRNNIQKALIKLRKRDDIEYYYEKNTYYYKSIN